MERENGDRIGKGALSKGQECVEIVYKFNLLAEIKLRVPLSWTLHGHV